jgi:hypothetical protein
MRIFFVRAIVAAALTLTCLDLPARAAATTGSFRGTVYQIDTVFNFVDVIMPGGTRRFFADGASVVHVHGRKAALIDMAMGEQVSGTYRVDAKGNRLVVTIDDVTRN